YMTENETFDTDFPNINDNDGAQDYRLFGGNALPNSNTVYTESFSARYRMTKNFSQCGAYSFTVGADDGYRLIIDGTTYIDNWTDGGYRTTTAVVYLTSSNHNLQLQYYDGGGGNRFSFIFFARYLDCYSKRVCYDSVFRWKYFSFRRNHWNCDCLQHSCKHT
ncbi:MAG: hypothetical protein IPF63_10200, partial [Bacteroidetes bacterium]|nr:hypothetical protein [Bacteroidota bacterium]